MGETVKLDVSYPENPEDPDSDIISKPFDVVVGKSLEGAPDKERLTVYTNGADHFDTGSSVGFFEIMARVGNPNTSTNTAAYQLLRGMPGLLHRLGVAELNLRV